jgi:hypothetical protein
MPLKRAGSPKLAPLLLKALQYRQKRHLQRNYPFKQRLY